MKKPPYVKRQYRKRLAVSDFVMDEFNWRIFEVLDEWRDGGGILGCPAMYAEFLQDELKPYVIREFRNVEPNFFAAYEEEETLIVPGKVELVIALPDGPEDDLEDIAGITAKFDAMHYKGRYDTNYDNAGLLEVYVWPIAPRKLSKFCKINGELNIKSVSGASRVRGPSRQAE